VKPTLLLFDIDGTLLRTRGAGRRAMARTFDSRYGQPEALKFRFDGMTDRAIMRGAMERLVGREEPSWSGEVLEAEVDALLAIYIDALADEAARATDFFVCPGVHSILDLCDAQTQVYMGLGTGNVMRGAEIKLGRVDLFARFSFGGYGSDHLLRESILRAAVSRGALAAQRPAEECRVVVIGDTPRDVAAARAIGAECISVATGDYSLDELRVCEPTHLLATLEDPRTPTMLFEG